MELLCQYCNASNRSNAKFCEQCGKPLGKQEAETPPSQANLVGSTFEPSVSHPSSNTAEEGSSESKSKTKRRPSTLPEQQPVTPPPQISTPQFPQSPPVKPVGVAFESSGGLRNGHPVSLPEQQGERKTTGVIPPKFRAKGDHIIGEVRQFKERSETEGQFTWIVFFFRVDRFDESGNQLQPVQVQMKGMEAHGLISDGDWVELPGSWNPGEIATPKEIVNLTTGAKFGTKVPLSTKIGISFSWIMFTLFVIVVVAIIIFIATS